MKPIFRDPALQTAFAKDGLVTVPLLSPDEAAELLAFYQSLPMQRQEGFHASMFQPDPALKRAADARIRELAAARTCGLLVGYRDLYANFMVKEPGAGSAMKVHQDWTYVDENEHISLAIWFPLLDTNAHNGGLFFVKGSHRIFNPVRGPGVKCPYEKVSQLLMEEYSTEIPLKAGEAVIWRHKLVHWSPLNLGEQARVAATIILVPEEAQVLHYFRNDNLPFDQVEKFAVDHDFYMDYYIMAGPEASRSLGVVEYDFDWLTEADIQKEFAPQSPPPSDKLSENDPSRSFLQKLKSLFQ